MLVTPLKVSGSFGAGTGLRSAGRQAGSTSSMLQAIALAITHFICFAFESLTESFIRFVLGEFALVGNRAGKYEAINSRLAQGSFERP